MLLIIVSTDLPSLRKKVSKEPFNKGFVPLIIICRDPRGKFFAKLSAKESGKKVGKEPFNNGFVLLLIICRNPRGKFFAKLSTKESGKNVGKEPFNTSVCANIEPRPTREVDFAKAKDGEEF